MRTERVASLLRQAIGDILCRRIEDTRIGFVSVVRVTVSKDLRYATVYYSQLGSDDERADTAKGLRSAVPFIQSALCRVTALKIVPQLRFRYDHSLEEGAYVLQQLNKLDTDVASSQLSTHP